MYIVLGVSLFFWFSCTLIGEALKYVNPSAGIVFSVTYAFILDVFPGVPNRSLSSKQKWLLSGLYICVMIVNSFIIFNLPLVFLFYLVASFVRSLIYTNKDWIVSIKFILAYGWHFSLVLIINTYVNASNYSYWCLVILMCAGVIPFDKHMTWLVNSDFIEEYKAVDWVQIKLQTTGFLLLLQTSSLMSLQLATLLWSIVTAKDTASFMWMWICGVLVSISSRQLHVVLFSRLVILFSVQFVHLFYKTPNIHVRDTAFTIRTIVSTLVLSSSLINSY